MERDVGHFYGDVAVRRTHGDAGIDRRQGRCVVDAVSDHFPEGAAHQRRTLLL